MAVPDFQSFMLPVLRITADALAPVLAARPELRQRLEMVRNQRAEDTLSMFRAERP